LKTGLDCACVIHGNLYDWNYVERLYSMVKRHVSCPLRFHVFTEQHRAVPDHMIKHALKDWPGVSGRKKGWWYKMQMFDPDHIAGTVLYFDLDVVITGDLDWVRELDTRYFWTIRDFKKLWRPAWKGINSSMMYWDTTRFRRIWHSFSSQDLQQVMRQFAGDQDFLTERIDQLDLRFLDESMIKSWRWEVKDGGMDMRTRQYRRPDAGAVLSPNTRVIIFHGSPKPHEIQDPVIINHWS